LLRFEKLHNDLVEKAREVTPRPTSPEMPTELFSAMAQRKYTHLTYGTLAPCFVPNTKKESNNLSQSAHEHCDALLQSKAVQRILSASDLTIPTYIIPFKRTFATHLRLSHFSGNLFNVTVLWSNAEVREKEGHKRNERGDDMVIGFDEHYEVEWVLGDDEGLAFKGGFWGKEGSDSRSPEGVGKESAEVWFGRE